jgi:hypothetical protein
VKSNPLTPIGNARLALMERTDFHAAAFARKRPDVLAKAKVLSFKAARARTGPKRPKPSSRGLAEPCLRGLLVLGLAAP